jgi:predicted RNA-binding Zn-ribbon protein involved in translation (DUF1610 family)
MLKRDDAREPEMLLQLAHAAAARMLCRSCGSGGARVELVPDADEWDGPAKECAACGARIPPERLELFPEMDLCATCQQQTERGQTPDEHDDYCPRCGTRMIVRSRRGSGVAGYEQVCPACRKK